MEDLFDGQEAPDSRRNGLGSEPLDLKQILLTLYDTAVAAHKEKGRLPERPGAFTEDPMQKVIELRHRDRQLLLLRREAHGGQHLGVRHKDRCHELLHVVAAGLFEQDPDLIVDAVLIPPADLFALGLEEGEAALPVACVPGPECLKPADRGGYDECGELLGVFGAGLGISGHVFHSLNRAVRIGGLFKLGVENREWLLLMLVLYRM